MTTSENEKPLVFVLMPFEGNFNHLFENCIRPAAERAGARAERVDLQKYTEKDVLERIEDQIDKASVLVGVMTGNRPSVFYEIGWAHALRKHVVLLTDNTDEIPYDLKQIPSLNYENIDEALVNKLSEELTWHLSHPTTGGRYYQEYKATFADVESLAGKLMPFFIPISKRRLLEWFDYIQKLTTVGVSMSGPERLEITRLLTLETKKYLIMEQFTENPMATHSRDWLDFYTEIGGRADIGKEWILCVEMDTVVQKRTDVEAAWNFFHERHFTTLHSTPKDYLRAAGKNLPTHQVVEVFGEYGYVKLVKLPQNSYTSGKNANVLITMFRESNSRDKDMLESIKRCSNIMDEEWFKKIPSRIPGARW